MRDDEIKRYFGKKEQSRFLIVCCVVIFAKMSNLAVFDVNAVD